MILKQNKVKIAIIPGDGVGPEVINVTLSVLNAIQDAVKGISLDYLFAEAGLACIPKYGTNLPEVTIQILKEADCCLKGPLTTQEEPGSHKSATVQIRRIFDLYANVRPVKTLPYVPALKPNIDMVIIRENTEGLYAGIEFMLSEKSAIAIRVITKKGCERIARFAFKLALKRRKHLTYVHKANILKITDGIFKDAIIRVAKDFPDVNLNEVRVDAMAMRLVKMPEIYDVIVTTNLFGDVLSDEAAQTVGGLGVVPGANIGDSYAMFETIHGSVPKYAGLDKVNPIASILASKLMLDWLGFLEAGERIEKGVKAVLREGKVLTYDLVSQGVKPSKCSEIGRRIANEILGK